MNIGELARRTGLSVKTIRYYSDEGLVPEASRTAAGYRRYDAGALARLEFVRSLRDLGLDLATIRRILDQRADLRAVASAHADVLATQIRLLKVQRAALRSLAGRGSGDLRPAEVERMNRIAQATNEERRRALGEFLDSIFDYGSGPVENDFTKMMRGVAPDLPDDPTDEQLDAWLELAELIHDESFRAKLREMGSWMKTSQAPDEVMPTDPMVAMELSELAFGRIEPLVAAGVVATDPAARPVVDDIVAAYAERAGRTPDDAYRRELAAATRRGYEPRAERYWQLMAVINGWAPVPPRMHLWGWFADAQEALLP
ncbi:MerR family transcriptional regulator [Virgisporangium aurantiacum]|uniref:MerR family transcriptional regulator n=1 Tax=Virgisporangium aurantiacum TaxID=175570 RepID=A0A8J3YZK1_9ACTN|nr:MerR family transcriptional regulator [Virgisporangium aurantiacum]GIJ53583.1 MerR family transcriptional regulator [Virgisporangium aurantiacum]